MQLPKSVPYHLIMILTFCLCQSHIQGQPVQIWQEQRRLHFIKDSIGLVNSLNRIGVLYFQKNIDSSFNYALKAKAVAVRLQYREGKTDADNIIARVLYQKGLKSESLQLYSRVLAAYRQESDTAKAAQVLMNMAIVYLRVDNRAKCKLFYRQALQTGSKLKQDSIMGVVYSNYCNVNTDLPPDSLSYYLNRSNAIASRYKDEAVLIYNMQTRAWQLLKQGRKQEAMLLIRRTLSLSKNAGLEFLETNAYFFFTDYYTNNPDSILYYGHKIYALNMQNGRALWATGLLDMISYRTELLGNKDEIIRVYRLLKTALIAENDNQKKFIGDYVKYSGIQSDNERLGIVNKSNRAKIWLLISVCSITILVVVIMYRLYQVSRRLNRQISEQNTQMQKTLTALEQSQADNTRMMQIVAHDLRNPISGMFSIASLMLNNTARSEEDKEFLELIKIAGENSLDLVNDLLQVNTKTEELKKEPVDVGQMLHYCVDLLRHKAEAKEQQIDLQATTVTVPVNREKLWRVVSNLIANAIKFSPVGAAISISLLEEANQIRIIVEDHGIGIPPEIAPKIFDMFTTAKRAGTAGEESFGLGLAISKQIVEAHGGKLWFESQPGKGTTFFVELPARG